MELDYGWASLDDDFIFKVVQILSSPHSLINVCRPATAILKKLVEADPISAPGPVLPSSSKGPPPAPPGSIYRYGFQVVFEQMRKEKALLETVVNRLGSADTAMVQHRYLSRSDLNAHLFSELFFLSMMLINSLLSHASDTRWEEFISELERLNVRKAVIVSNSLSFYSTCIHRFYQQHLMALHIMEDLTSCILDFQANIVRITYRKKTTLVDPEGEDSHAAALDHIWSSSQLEEEVDEQELPSKWRQLGFESEDMVQEFSEVGVLGLDCLVFISTFSSLSLMPANPRKSLWRRTQIFQVCGSKVRHDGRRLNRPWSSFLPAYSRAVKPASRP